MMIYVEFYEMDMTLEADFGELYERPQGDVYSNGYSDGYETGSSEGYEKGSLEGFTNGYNEGETAGYTKGYNEGETSGYTKGYNEGFEAGSTQGTVGASIDTLLDKSIKELYSDTTVIGSYSCYNCYELEKAILPKAKEIDSYGFANCINLSTVDLTDVETIQANSFRFAALQCFIIRAETLCALKATSAFQLSGLSKKTGYIYVPAALVDSYKAATNWSAYAERFRTLEEYTVDGTITGELDETKIGV